MSYDWRQNNQPFNPYPDRLNRPNQFLYPPQMPMQMSAQAPVIQGRLVSNINEITPRQVPMDGSVGIFPQNDYSCIYAKSWTSQGTIRTVRFVPEVAEQPSDAKDPLSEIREHLDRIEKMLQPAPKKTKNEEA